MARTAVSPATSGRAGAKVTFVAAPDPQLSLVNDSEDTILLVKNAGTGAVTVTIPMVRTVDGVALPSKTASIPNDSATYALGPFPKALYNQDDGSVYFELSGTTSVDVAALRVGNTNY